MKKYFENMPKPVKYGLFLGILGIVVGALLAFVNNVTKPIIEEQEKQKITASLNEVNNQYTWITENDERLKGAFAIGLDGDTVKLYVYKTSTKGYKSGEVAMMVFINPDGNIDNLVLLSMADQTKGIGTQIENQDYLNSFIGKNVNEYQGKAVNSFNSKSADVISGATYSSRAVIEAIIIASNDYVEGVQGGNK